MDSIERSKAFFEKGYSCSQSVFLAFADQFGIDPDTAARMASAFGGGMGRMGGTCGAVSGALMVLGLSRGGSDPADKATKEKTYALARSLQETFRARMGALGCNDLLGVDIGTPEGQERARTEGRFKNCSKYVEQASGILVEILK